LTFSCSMLVLAGALFSFDTGIGFFVTSILPANYRLHPWCALLVLASYFGALAGRSFES
jgi:hypothetical protein